LEQSNSNSKIIVLSTPCLYLRMMSSQTNQNRFLIIGNSPSHSSKKSQFESAFVSCSEICLSDGLSTLINLSVLS